jgi:hypothetical protein
MTLRFQLLYEEAKTTHDARSSMPAAYHAPSENPLWLIQCDIASSPVEKKLPKWLWLLTLSDWVQPFGRRPVKIRHWKAACKKT